MKRLTAIILIILLLCTPTVPAFATNYVEPTPEIPSAEPVEVPSPTPELPDESAPADEAEPPSDAEAEPPSDTESEPPSAETESEETIILNPTLTPQEAQREALARIDSEVSRLFAVTETAAGVTPTVSSPSAILIERSTGTVIFEQNADVIRVPASITKVMTMLLVVEALESGAISLDDVITTSRHAADMGGSQIFLREGEQMTVHELLKATTVNSANDAATALAEHLAGSEEAFAQMMNERAAALGMVNTHFTNCSGLLESDTHRTTARDIAIMSRELLAHDLIREYTMIWTDWLRGDKTALINTNRMIRYFSGATGLKTGFTSAAGHCIVASAERDGVEYIAVTLGDTTSNARFESARDLLSFAFATYTLSDITPDAALPPMRVTLGKTRYIQPEILGPQQLLVLRSQAEAITKTLTLSPTLYAPVRRGDVVGELTITTGDEILAILPVTAAEESAARTWGEIFRALLSVLITPCDDDITVEHLEW